MIRQYGAHRSMGGHNPLRVGVIPTGAIFYLQDDVWWRDRFRGKPVCRTPWIVECFFNRVRKFGFSGWPRDDSMVGAS